MKHSLLKRQAFSLMEIMVAMSVLVLLGYIIAQVTGATSKTTRLSNQMVDTASQARLVFGCLEADLTALVKRPDVPLQAQNAAIGATNLLCFVSGVTSASATPRDVSIIAYQVATCADNTGPDRIARPCLVRAANAISWTQTDYFGLDSTGLPISFPSTLLPQTSDFDLLAPGVIRMVIGFQLYPDNLPATLQDTTLIANARGQVVYSPPVRTVVPYGGGTSTTVIDLSRISALVVGLVVIDLNSLRLLSATQVTTLGSAFAIPANDTLPVPFWGPSAASPDSLPSSVPLPARQSLRIFQRFYPITPFVSRLISFPSSTQP